MTPKKKFEPAHQRYKHLLIKKRDIASPTRRLKHANKENTKSPDKEVEENKIKDIKQTNSSDDSNKENEPGLLGEIKPEEELYDPREASFSSI
jgi:hypothetical protein